MSTNDDDALPYDDTVSLDLQSALHAELDKAYRLIADYKTLIADFDNSRKYLKVHLSNTWW
jgi:hypothetical protein